MGKTSKNKKRRLANALVNEIDSEQDDTNGSPVQESSRNDLNFLSGLISPGELKITMKTLKTLNFNSELISSGKNELKVLKGLIFEFQRISNQEINLSSLISKIDFTLNSSLFSESLILLNELKLKRIVPKLGTLQRWVRLCDCSSTLDGSFGNELVLTVLDAILRTTQLDYEQEEEEEEDVMDGTTKKKKKSIVKRMEEFKLRQVSGESVYEQVQLGLLPLPLDIHTLAKAFPLIHTTPGPLRLPPNHHPALLYTSNPSTVPLNLSLPPAISHPVPQVPGAFLLSDVLTREECQFIITSAESVGFKPDQPIGEGSSSILAHNLYWLADAPFLSTIWNRIKDSMPIDPVYGSATGLNARFRVYRYVPGSIYRPHYDGRWPASGLDPVTGEYMYDSSPPDEPHWSRFTFLLYLNDSFTQGHTTFFLPSPPSHTLKKLLAYPVKPICGSALVFPHGDAKGSLLHEGSPIGIGGGGKYVIRTDVLYRSTVGDKVSGEMKGDGEGMMS